MIQPNFVLVATGRCGAIEQMCWKLEPTVWRIGSLQWRISLDFSQPSLCQRRLLAPQYFQPQIFNCWKTFKIFKCWKTFKIFNCWKTFEIFKCWKAFIANMHEKTNWDKIQIQFQNREVWSILVEIVCTIKDWNDSTTLHIEINGVNMKCVPANMVSFSLASHWHWHRPNPIYATNLGKHVVPCYGKYHRAERHCSWKLWFW